MARYYRRRYTRVVKPKKKWASNIRAIDMGGSLRVAKEKVAYSQELCVNSSEVGAGSTITSPTPTIVKTGNFKVQCDCVYTVTIPPNVSPSVEAFLYIMYLPEGVGVATADDEEVDYVLLNGLVLKHPEWILAWRHFGSDATITSNSPTDVQRIQFSSRLKRNLNSGDRVCAVLIAHSHHSTATFSRLECHGMCQFWTCAN